MNDKQQRIINLASLGLNLTDCALADCQDVGEVTSWYLTDEGFRDKFEQARLELEISALKVVRETMVDDARIAQWVLSNVYPEKYGPKRDRPIEDDSDDAETRFDLSKLSDEELEILRKLGGE